MGCSDFARLGILALVFCALALQLSLLSFSHCWLKLFVRVVLKEETKIVQSRNAKTQYIVIPADKLPIHTIRLKLGKE